MTKRMLLAGLLGGLALFLWEFVAHDLTPLGDTGLSSVPNEETVRAMLKQNIPQSGLFYFPAPENSPGMTAQQKKDAMAKAMDLARSGPVGFMAFQRDGGDTLSARQLVTQFVLDVLAVLLAAMLLARVPASGFAARVGFVTALGLIPALRSQIPMWNWYGFPASYAAAQIAIDLLGFFIAGLVVAKLAQSRARTMAAAS